MGACPKCGHKVYENGMAYVCEQSVAVPRTCDFRSGKIILQQEVTGEQMTKLLSEGKTALLPGFVSMRTRRKFKAYLVRGAEGKITFEFEPRPAREGKGAPKAGKQVAAQEAQTANGTTKDSTGKKTIGKKPAARKSAAKKPAATKASR